MYLLPQCFGSCLDCGFHELLIMCDDRYIVHFFVSVEVIGAIVSVLIIWLVTGVLCYEAVMRIIRNDIEIDADIMLITACVGVFVNVL